MNQHPNYYFRNKGEKSVLNNCSSLLTKVTVYTIMAEIWKPSNKDLLLFLPSIASLHHPLAWTYLQLFHFQSNHELQFLFQHHLSLQISVSHRSLQELPLQPNKCCHLLRKNGIQWDGRGQNKDNAKEKPNWPHRIVRVCNRVHLILIGFDKIYDDKVRKTKKLSHHIYFSKEKVSYEPLSPSQHSCLVGLTKWTNDTVVKRLSFL